ncbi:hypothetical protein M9H77_20762 [Catharanthus roseus]|uniref:Uncharacterized protein n=1 Tax=Catharanthus roseus TaxID=4058 RepID=A0ACC0AMP9_CATRO|nr:hypothetical protein M9H77_20762 [Catharanthus roseus]
MKKTKLDISIELEGVEDIHMEENIQVDEQPPLSESWTAKLFPNVEDESEFDLAGDLYTGNDEDEKEESEWFRDDMEVVDLVESFWPKITVTREERRRWCKPWKRALVLRLLETQKVGKGRNGSRFEGLGDDMIDEDQLVDVQVLREALNSAPSPTTHSMPNSKPKSNRFTIRAILKTSVASRSQSQKKDKERELAQIPIKEANGA